MSSIRGKQSAAEREQSGAALAATNGQSAPNEAVRSRLVFGLSSRTNRHKHDEYAERRSGQQQQQAPQTSEPKQTPGVTPAVRKQVQAGNMSENGKPVNEIRASKLAKPQDSPALGQAGSLGSGTPAKPALTATGKGARIGRSPDKPSSNGEVRRRSISGGGSAERQPVKQSSEHKDKPTVLKQQQQQQQQPATRMQFNIPPPPKMSASPTGSVVSYAKARIYEKPARQAILSGRSLLESGAIPESILSGFKPPKQVNVSQAREKWEGGEPFARCKSRQRLAAQAGKKLLHGTWSMSSVVVQQQFHLQQALSSSSSGSRLASARQPDSSMKLLTRGSVLERVQQFERAPLVVSAQALTDEPGECESAEASVIIERGQPESVELHSGPASKQAIYKTRVSSLQYASQPTTSGQLAQQAAAAAAVGPAASSAPMRAGRRLSLRRRSSISSHQSIPRFYHPNGKPNTYEIELQKKNIEACFDKFPDRKALLSGPNYRRHFHSIALACGFSEYFKEPLFLYVRHHLAGQSATSAPALGQLATRKQSGAGLPATMLANGSGPARGRPLARAASIDSSSMEYLTCDQFLVCWRQLISACFDQASRFVHLLTLGRRQYLEPDDLVPLIQSVINDHPGLKFLRAAPDFHMRYVQTVIARIYFCVNRSWTGKITVPELRRSNLLAVLQVLSQEEDINQITDYFSYEHFYVIYCKFWALDQDHDLLISKEDLARHNEAAISARIIERIFQGTVSRQVQQTGKMSYSDFVWFLLAEEDKKHPRSVEYWFRLMDIDGDGFISMYEMEYFYQEQARRLELMSIEPLPFLDSACQILDLVNPKEKHKISLSDLKRTKMATIFFDTFINLEKYLEHESREFVSTRDVVQGGVVISDWDRYASEEYESLVSEESAV